MKHWWTAVFFGAAGGLVLWAIIQLLTADPVIHVPDPPPTFPVIVHEYDLVDLGDVDGAPFYPAALNNVGQVVGSIWTEVSVGSINRHSGTSSGK